jgi:hypothetical protein
VGRLTWRSLATSITVSSESGSNRRSEGVCCSTFQCLQPVLPPSRFSRVKIWHGRSGRSPSSESACVFTFEFVRHRLRAFQRQDLWVLLVHSWTNIGQHQHPLRGSQSVRMDKRSGTKRPDQGTWFGLLTLVSRVRILPAPPHGTSASWGRVKVA